MPTDGVTSGGETDKCFYPTCSESSTVSVRRRDCFITRDYCDDHACDRLSRSPIFVKGMWGNL